MAQCQGSGRSAIGHPLCRPRGSVGRGGGRPRPAGRSDSASRPRRAATPGRRPLPRAGRSRSRPPLGGLRPARPGPPRARTRSWSRARTRPSTGPRSSGDRASSYRASTVGRRRPRLSGPPRRPGTGAAPSAAGHPRCAARPTPGSPRCASRGSSQPGRGTTSASTKATSGVSTRSIAAIRAAPGPPFVARRISSAPATAASGGHDPSSTTSTRPTAPKAPTTGETSTSKAGITTVTSLRRYGPSVGRGWMAPASSSRSSWRATGRRCGDGRVFAQDQPSSTATPFAERRNNAAASRRAAPGPVEPAAAGVEHVGRHRRGRGRSHRSTASARSPASLASMRRPSSALAPVGSPSTPFGLTDARRRPRSAAAARARATGAGLGPLEVHDLGRRASSTDVSTRPAWLSPASSRGDHDRTRRPSWSRVATARASGSALPPWPLTNTTPRVPHRPSGPARRRRARARPGRSTACRRSPACSPLAP